MGMGTVTDGLVHTHEHIKSIRFGHGRTEKNTTARASRNDAK
jgi:hypothetical protein